MNTEAFYSAFITSIPSRPLSLTHSLSLSLSLSDRQTQTHAHPIMLLSQHAILWMWYLDMYNVRLCRRIKQYYTTQILGGSEGESNLSLGVNAMRQPRQDWSLNESVALCMRTFPNVYGNCWRRSTPILTASLSLSLSLSLYIYIYRLSRNGGTCIRFYRSHSQI